MRRIPASIRTLLALGAIAGLQGCASGSSSGSRASVGSGDYYGGSIHRNTFPETFGGGGGPGAIGRPDRQRF